MKTQNLIKRKLSQPESVVVIQQILEDNSEAPRSAIAERVCEHFEFFNAFGRAQRSGCLDALRELERAGRFQLPPSRRQAPRASPRRCTEPVEVPHNVPAAVGQIGQLELIRVETESEVRLWNALMIDEHPRGAGPLVGAQVRYLVGSAHGGSVRWGSAHRPCSSKIGTSGSAGMHKRAASNCTASSTSVVF